MNSVNVYFSGDICRIRYLVKNRHNPYDITIWTKELEEKLQTMLSCNFGFTCTNTTNVTKIYFVISTNFGDVKVYPEIETDSFENTLYETDP